jgi:hypothetical protein
MWLLGGWNPRDKEHFPRICNNAVWNSADGKKWTLVNDDVSWGPRTLHYTVVFQDKIWVIGGSAVFKDRI